MNRQTSPHHEAFLRRIHGESYNVGNLGRSLLEELKKADIVETPPKKEKPARSSTPISPSPFSRPSFHY